MQNPQLSPQQLSCILNCLYLQLFALNEGNSPGGYLDEPIDNIKNCITALGYNPDALPDNEGEPLIQYPDPNYVTIMSY